jgi:hypothetical protein
MPEREGKGSLLPFVRHMLVCEHAEAARHNPRRANIFGVFANVVVKAQRGGFPFSLGFSLYVMLSDCRGGGTARVVVTEAESEEVRYSSVPYTVLLGSDPLQIHGLFFRVAECLIPREGLYWIEFEFDGVSIAEEPLLVNMR